MQTLKKNWMVLIFVAMVVAMFFIPNDKVVHVKYSIRIEMSDTTGLDSVTVKTVIDRSIESITTDLDSIYISNSND